MQNASNVRDPWLKNGCATSFETRPQFRVIFSFLYTDVFNVILLFCFAGRNAAGCSKKHILWIFKKGPPQAPLLSVWIVAKKNWFHQSESHLKIDATLEKHNMFSFFSKRVLVDYFVFSIVITLTYFIFLKTHFFLKRVYLYIFFMCFIIWKCHFLFKYVFFIFLISEENP